MIDISSLSRHVSEGDDR